ncbi:MAG: hypothetical protein ABFR82_03225 [Nitrospirota bacterium]
MTKKLWAIILSLMLAFSLSLITGCQKANEKTREVKEEATETKVENKKEAAETVKKVTVEEVKEKAVETAEKIEEEAEEKLKEPEPLIETKTFPAPTLITESDYSDPGSTVSVTLKWNAVISPYGNSVKYFVRIYSGDGLIYPSGWISGTNWTKTIPSPCNYSWKVKAKDDVYLQESEWSTTDQFLVNTHCSDNDD